MTLNIMEEYTMLKLEINFTIGSKVKSKAIPVTGRGGL
jgi:hypothetical protein